MFYDFPTRLILLGQQALKKHSEQFGSDYMSEDWIYCLIVCRTAVSLVYLLQLMFSPLVVLGQSQITGNTNLVKTKV